MILIFLIFAESKCGLDFFEVADLLEQKLLDLLLRVVKGDIPLILFEFLIDGGVELSEPLMVLRKFA